MYDECFQPGHLEAGSLGRLVDGHTNLFVVERLPDLTKIHVQYNRVFDLVSLITTGIPSRDTVLQLDRSIPLVPSTICLSEEISCATLVKDYQLVKILEHRLQYCQTIVKLRTQLIPIIQKYYASTQEDATTLFDYRIIPRLGLSRLPLRFMPNKHPIPYQVLERITNITAYHEQIVAIVLRHASAGIICNESSARHIINVCHKMQQHQPSVFQLFRLPSVMTRIQDHQISPECLSLDIFSRDEENRIKQWCAQQVCVTWRGTSYWSSTWKDKKTLLKILKPNIIEQFLCQRVVNVLPEMIEEISLSNLPKLYHHVPEISLRINALRETAALSLVHGVGESLPQIQTGLEKLQKHILEQYHIDLLTTPWIELPIQVRQIIIQYCEDGALLET